MWKVWIVSLMPSDLFFPPSSWPFWLSCPPRGHFTMLICLMELQTGEENILCFPSLSTYLFFLALSLKKIYWSIADLQCCVSFKGTAKWFHYTCTYIFIIFQILFPYRLLQNIEYSSLCYTVGPCWLFTLYIVVCVFQSQAPNLSLPFPPPYTFPVW